MMLINPEKMALIYKTVKFDLFEFERGYERGMNSSVYFFAPICGRCLFMNRLTEEMKQKVPEGEGFRCGVRGCTNQADFFVEFNFGFEESDVEEIQNKDKDPMEELYNAELNFD